MAFFKSRKGADETAATARQPESIEAMRRRAKHRLIGASVLVLAAVVGFPLLFDTQPRPISVDIPIEIPDRNKVKALPAPPPSAGRPVAQAAGPAPAPAPATSASPAIPAPASAAKAAPAPAPAPVVAKAETAPEPKPAPRPQADSPAPAKAPAPKDDGSKALALLEGGESKSAAAAPAAESAGRYVVQIGSFSDNAKARETRLKAERAGLKTYTQVVEKDGHRMIRVRVGPFASKAEADKAAAKLKGLELPAAVLTL